MEGLDPLLEFRALAMSQRWALQARLLLQTARDRGILIEVLVDLRWSHLLRTAQARARGLNAPQDRKAWRLFCTVLRSRSFMFDPHTRCTVCSLL